MSSLGGRQVLPVALVGLALLGAACSDDDKAEPPTNSAVTLAISAVHGLAVFPNAVADPASSTPGREVFRVAGKTPENVVAFYRGGFALTDANDTLDVCTQNLTPPFELTWRVSDTNDFVVVQVEGDGATSQPGSILTIIDDKANTTRTCTTP